MVLRPSVAEILQPPERLSLWHKVFSRFFLWVWLFSLITVCSGLAMIYLYGGVNHLPMHIHVMLLAGGTMFVIFVYLYFTQFKPFVSAVSAQDWPQAAEILATIRKLVATNLSLAATIFAVLMLGQVL
jgi:uncharacterized membrane protein